MQNIIEPSRHDNLATLARSSSIPNSEASHNSVYFSSNFNHLSAKFLWNINGSKLEIYSYNCKCNNRLISLFDFGQIFDDQSIAISCVIRLSDGLECTSKFRNPFILVVILSLANNKSYICIVNVRLNSVLNTIDFPFNITCAEVILSGTPTDTENYPLARSLLCMNGILAVGCDGGLVFFLDLMLDSYSPMPLIPKQISIACKSANIDLQNKRRTANFHNQVICIPLNEDANFRVGRKGKFNYRTKDGKVLASYAANCVYVSAIHFVPQLSLICVGYNFGGFHLYGLRTNSFGLECSCGLDSDLLPIISFAYQSPENDPKNYSYLWVVRGFNLRTPNLEDVKQKSCSIAFMYLLCYETKDYIASYGISYSDFTMCCCKFEFPLSSNPYDKNSGLHSSSKLLDVFTINQVSSLKLSDEETSPIDQNLLFIGWQASQNSSEKTSYYFLLFDLNQWYKTQMPKCFCVDDGGLCPFMAIYSFNNLAKTFAPESIQAIFLHNNSISKFHSNLFYLDIHSYPVSLSFNLTLASQTKISNTYYLGFQKQLLNQFAKIGPSILVEPEDFVAKCFQFGLISNEHYNLASDITNEIVTKRELLLNIALENGQTSFLVNTIKEWSNGELMNIGCSSKHLLEWIWKKVSSVKKSIDILTKPLFDYSGREISPHDVARLVSNETDLSTLTILLKQLRIHASSLTQIGFDQLIARSEIVGLIRSYLKIILYFTEYSLLPEVDCCDRVDCDTGSTTLYSYQNLSKFYAKRRKDFISINPNLFTSDDVLLIDAIVHHLDPQITELWKKSDISDSTSSCLYPPRNLHSLIRIFLIESIPLVYKESILLYFLLDFCECLPDQHIYLAQKISIFTTSLNIGEGLRNFVQALWSLDHQHYESALQLLTHPMVTASMTDFKVNATMFNAIMQRIVELFLFDNQFKSALIFKQSCGHFLIDSEQNENLYIQMLLLNGNLTGAFDFQRQRRSESNSRQILFKLFFVCEKTNLLSKVCRLSLDEFEESVLVDFLLYSSHPQAKKILILYFILNNKLLEAINIAKELADQLDLGVEENRRLLDLIQAYSSRIPHPLFNLADEVNSILLGSNSTNLPAVNSNEQTAIKINPKKRNLKKISGTLSFEKMLEMNEYDFKPKTNRLQSPLAERHDKQPRPLYLSPSVSRFNKVTKAKNQNVTKDLFMVLKTPDVLRMRKFEIGTSELTFTESPRKPSILKHIHDESESDRMSDSQHKMKVSFKLNNNNNNNNNNNKQANKKTSFDVDDESILPNSMPQMDAEKAMAINDNIANFATTHLPETFLTASTEAELHDDDETATNTDQSEVDELQSTGSESNRRKTRHTKKNIDTPTHRMKLRSKKP